MLQLRPLSLSLDSLLDYTDKDIEESTFEVSFLLSFCLNIDILFNFFHPIYFHF